MMKPLIKICGLKDPELAYETAISGADFVGLVFHPASKRYITLENAILVAEQIKHGGAQPVAVFVDADASFMQEVCEKTGITIVQLHGDIARNEQKKLPVAMQRIYVLHIDAQGDITNEAQLHQENLLLERDFLLFDGLIYGSGKTINLKNIKKIKNMRFFLASGLNKTNVISAINTCQPFAVDVSSGVESSPGEKDLNLIKEFIDTVRLCTP